MSKYNKKAVGVAPNAVTHEGGPAYKYEPKIELVSILATGLENKFYEKEGEREKRLATVIAEVAKSDKTFAAKALVYARTVMGQRTATHFGAVELAKVLSGDSLGARFFSKRDRKANRGGIIFRLDDMLEIAACYQARNAGKPLSNAIKKGFKDALENADEYELAKYQAKNRDLSLVDIVNLVHPKPTGKMVEVFAKLMKGELKQFNTVEDKNTKAGQEVAAKVKEGKITAAEAATELAAAKEDNYAELIATRKIGYLALLRNLRNILKTGAKGDVVKGACELLMDQKLIKQSLVFPHQIDLALEIMIEEFGASGATPFIKALNAAYELAIPNLTELFPAGKTAVVFDSSGSMLTPIAIGDMAKRKKGSEGAIAKAALIAATLAKGIGADVYHFADFTEAIKFNPLDTVNTLKKQFLDKQGAVGYGTEFNSILKTIGSKYDRVFIISDMQGASLLGPTLNKHVYSIDICGYGTTSIKLGSKVYSLHGYSADIYELVKKVELNFNVVIDEINKIEI